MKARRGEAIADPHSAYVAIFVALAEGLAEPVPLLTADPRLARAVAVYADAPVLLAADSLPRHDDNTSLFPLGCTSTSTRWCSTRRRRCASRCPRPGYRPRLRCGWAAAPGRWSHRCRSSG